MKKLFLFALSLGVSSLLLVGCGSRPLDTHQLTGSLDSGAVVETASVVSKCGLTILSPAPNTAISSNVPLVFSGVIDNSQAQTLGCQRGMFEGQAGTAQLYYKNGTTRGPIGTVSVIPVSDRTSTGPVTFSVSVMLDNSNAGFPSGTPIKVTFTEENPSGQTPDTLDFPLVLQ